MILTDVGVSTLFAFLLFPTAVMFVMSIALIPCLLSPGIRIGSAIKALYCYIMQTIGVAMMTAGALPAIYGVLDKFSAGADRFSAEVYLTLVIFFSIGGVIFLWHEQMTGHVDDESRMVPALLFWYTFKAIGNVVILIGLSSFTFMMLLTKSLDGSWWIIPVIAVLYGLLLSWCTKTSSVPSGDFSLVPLRGAKATAAGKRKK